MPMRAGLLLVAGLLGVAVLGLRLRDKRQAKANRARICEEYGITEEERQHLADQAKEFRRRQASKGIQQLYREWKRDQMRESSFQAWDLHEHKVSDCPTCKEQDAANFGERKEEGKK